MATEAKSTVTDDDSSSSIDDQKVQIKKILVPIDGHSLFCIHVIGSVPYYGYMGSPAAIEQYYKDLEQKAQSWFDKVRGMARNEGISEPSYDVRYVPPASPIWESKAMKVRIGIDFKRRSRINCSRSRCHVRSIIY